jgi:Flp pilus assembly protein TadD
VEEAKRLSPRDTRVLYAHGMVMHALGRRLEARADFRRLLEIDPKYERSGEVSALIP